MINSDHCADVYLREKVDRLEFEPVSLRTHIKDQRELIKTKNNYIDQLINHKNDLAKALRAQRTEPKYLLGPGSLWGTAIYERNGTELAFYANVSTREAAEKLVEALNKA